MRKIGSDRHEHENRVLKHRSIVGPTLNIRYSWIIVGKKIRQLSLDNKLAFLNACVIQRSALPPNMMALLVARLVYYDSELSLGTRASRIFVCVVNVCASVEGSKKVIGVAFFRKISAVVTYIPFNTK